MSTLGKALAGVRCDIEPGSGNYHFALSGCDDCNARWVARMTLEQVERWYRSGHVGQALYEAYCHIWATGAPRFSSSWDAWKVEPTDPEVIALVKLIRTAPR